tara:strand:- start:545 stop:847 length:303 start_codon:yes stop_codon:yes gene_type:complete
VTKIKLSRRGEVNVFDEGARIIMKKDVVVSGAYGEDDVFITSGTPGYVYTTYPEVSIELESEYGDLTIRRIYLQDGYLLTDLAELIDGTHLRLVKEEVEE